MPSNSCLDIAAVGVVRIAGKAATSLSGISVPRENGDPIPAFLAVPDRAIAKLCQGGLRKFLLGRLQLLQAHNIRP